MYFVVFQIDMSELFHGTTQLLPQKFSRNDEIITQIDMSDRYVTSKGYGFDGTDVIVI